jgi:hypothetical protein
MSISNLIAKPAAIVLTVISMGCMVATAQAQTGKRMIVAMAPADVGTTPETNQVRVHERMSAPRAKHIALAPVAKTDKPDCFWCNRTVLISGVTY